MKSFFGWALFCASLLCGGVSYGQSYSDPGCSAPSACEGCNYDPCCLGNWLDNTVIFGGADVYKGLGERITNINGGIGALTSSFGAVTGFNTGFALGDSNIRGQIGGSYGVYDFEGRLAVQPNARSTEEQFFVTTGIYKRGDMLNDCDAVSWGIVLDAFNAASWGVNSQEINLGQVRAIYGYALNECTEIGVWGTLSTWTDNAAVTVAGAPGVISAIRAQNQGNIYLRKDFGFGGNVMFYTGIFDSANISDWQVGMNAVAPLGPSISLYANFNYVIPGAPVGPAGAGEEQYNASCGLVYYFGGKSVAPSISGHKGLPLLNVANPGSFLVTD